MTNLLVTGGAGYVGSHIVKRFVKDGCRVVVYDNLSHGHREAVDKNAVFIEGDLKDKKKLDMSIKKYRIDAVMHMAAFVSVAESSDNPKKYYDNNVTCGINLLNSAKKNKIRHIVFSSSSVVYGTKSKMPLKESDKANPENPYGETKLIFESLLRQADARDRIKSISLRYFNAAGADSQGNIGEFHEPETHLIPNVLISALGDRNEIDVFGNDYKTKDGTAVRDYIHVSDIADAHIIAMEALLSGHETDVYNLGNEKGYSVLEIIKIAEEVTDKKISINLKPRRFGDVPVAIANSKKIKKELKWKPKCSSIKNIMETAWNWHRKHPNGFIK